MKGGFRFISVALTLAIGVLNLVSNFVEKKNVEATIQEQVDKAVAAKLNK